jgi:hypothetical protein
MKAPVQWFRVKNFERFQHYKDRNPPWIKLYATLLEDYEFSQLDDASKAHLMLIWLLAGKHQNRLRLDARWVQARTSTKQRVNLTKLVESGFLIIINDDDIKNDSKMLAGCKQSVLSETETEQETETAASNVAPDSKTPDAAAAEFLQSAEPEKDKNPNPRSLDLLQKFKIKTSLIKQLAIQYPYEHIRRTAELTAERMNGKSIRNPTGFFLTLLKDDNQPPSQAETERTRAEAEVKERTRTQAREKIETDQAAAEARRMDDALTLWESETWAAMSPKDRTRLDSMVAKANPVLKVRTSPAWRLKRMEAWNETKMAHPKKVEAGNG